MMTPERAPRWTPVLTGEPTFRAVLFWNRLAVKAVMTFKAAWSWNRMAGKTLTYLSRRAMCVRAIAFRRRRYVIRAVWRELVIIMASVIRRAFRNAWRELYENPPPIDLNSMD